MNTNTNSTTITTTKMPHNRGGAGEIETFAMANCLMLLSSHNATMAASVGGSVGNSVEENGRMFACKTCGRKFSSFQALGGHRASHKKVKSANSGEFSDEANFPAKPKVHVCSICFVEFPIGQALGGHMRRHRGITAAAATAGAGGGSAAMSSVTTEGSIGNSDGNNDNNGEKKRKIDDVVLEVPTVVMKSSSKRVCMDVDLDLDLTLWRKEQKVEEEDNVDHEVEEGEIVEQGKDDDYLKLELRQPIRF